MEQRQFLLKMTIVIAFAFGWLQLAPRLFPQLFPAPEKKRPALQPAQPSEPRADAPPALEAADDSLPVQLVEHPHVNVELGSLEPDSGFFAAVQLTSRGGSVESIQLNDPRYARITDQSQPLKIVGNNQKTRLRTFNTSLAAIDTQLSKFDTFLDEVEWEVVPNSQTDSEVTFRYVAPDGSLELRKHYRLRAGNPADRDGDAFGYVLDFDLTLENRLDESREVTYVLQGPVGLPLEDEENSRTFIEIKIGTLDDPADADDVTPIHLTAAELVKQAAKAVRDPAAVDTWKAPLKYAGVDVQYFAAIVLPQASQLKEPYFRETRPMVVARHPQRPEWSDVSIVMTSEPVTLPGGGTARHDFALYFGPKRSELLRVLGAEPVKDFGWFGVISRGMLAILNFFHHTLYVPYGLAIVLLTVVVRGCLFPVSRKMAENQNRMKELQPKMQEIREKYKDDQEKMAEAYREFMAKHGFNPLAGCLPMFLQLPIFIGLYQALYHAVDLRLARFLWIDNLAAPDELFPLGFTVPFVGWTDFNLLPLITIGLFLVQQKMFMPPPTSEEQALQYKMMNYFTLFLGFMFYRVPAGLCVYFIASSLWGLAERKLLTLFERPKSATEDGTGPSPGGRGDEPPRGGGPAGEAGPKPPGLLQRLREAADQAKQQAGGAPVPRDDRRKDRRPGRRKSRHGR